MDNLKLREELCKPFGGLKKETVDELESIVNNHTKELLEQRNELLEFVNEFFTAIESEEIIIKENFDNDGFENCGGRLISKANELINKITK